MNRAGLVSVGSKIWLNGRSDETRSTFTFALYLLVLGAIGGHYN